MAERKRQLATAEFEWYPYDSFGSLLLAEKLLAGRGRSLRELTSSGPVLDVGCADGDLSFFLESEGCAVDAVDWRITNHNFLRGFRRLHAALGSRVSLYEVDLDARFELPDRYYTIAFFLGALYHLKNPFYALETLASRAYYCLLSTRIARWTPDQRTELQPHPVAYLVDADEFELDDSNYWVFSETGLRRLLRRSGWDVVEWTTFGDASHSDPLHPERDERAYCLLRSRGLSMEARVLLGEGWHAQEAEAWRWTERRFRVELLDLPAEPLLELRGHVPKGLAPMTLRVSADGNPLPAFEIREEGDFVYATSLPSSTTSVLFEASRAHPPDAADRRERALIVKSSSLQRLIRPAREA